jgi:hypothetical protein
MPKFYEKYQERQEESENILGYKRTLKTVVTTLQAKE